MNNDFSVLFGGKAGDGVDTAGLLIGRILNQLGWRLYIYRDYPSVIRGGHTFSIIRAGKNKISAHREKVDFIIALNQETLDLHRPKLKKDCFFIYDADQAKPAAGTCGTGVAVNTILKEENAPVVMRNSCLIGAFCKAAGIKWDILDNVFRKNIAKEIGLNLKVARRGYDSAQELTVAGTFAQAPLPVVSGNEAIGMGLLKAGLNAYVAYPMTPSSAILHFLAGQAKDFSLKVVHPESEIAVVLMALGFSYMGERVAVGTSGGGFCLMTEGLSFSGIAELPVVFMVGQRTGPSTGLPTYTAQTELHFVLNAGQGEFSRMIAAPGDPEEAYFWSAAVLSLSWKYQIAGIILSDKTLSEGNFSFDLEAAGAPKKEDIPLWDKNSPYKRYQDTQSGVSPLAFVPQPGQVIKINSYEHDENGITTEDAKITKAMQEKRLRKEKYLAEDLENYETVKTYGNGNSSVAVLCWGSNKGVCVEAAENLGIKVIQPVVLWPFPEKQFQEALKGVKRLICVENNATGQLALLIQRFGFGVNEKILKYDGRPFTGDELEEKLRGVLR